MLSGVVVQWQVWYGGRHDSHTQQTIVQLSSPETNHAWFEAEVCILVEMLSLRSTLIWPHRFHMWYHWIGEVQIFGGGAAKPIPGLACSTSESEGLPLHSFNFGTSCNACDHAH